MSIIDKLKSLRDRLPNLTLKESVQKETTLKDPIIEAELKVNTGENIPPCIGPAKEDYILLNTFTARFKDEGCFIKPDQIFIVTKPSYSINDSKVEHEFKISFTMIDAKYFIGKPTEYTNFKLDQEIMNLVKEFNNGTFSIKGSKQALTFSHTCH